MVAAFFDVDHTMLPGASLERLFVRNLWHRGGLGLRDLVRMGASILRSGRGSLTRRIKSNKAYLAGKPVADVEAHAKPFVMEVIRPRLSDRALEMLEWHRRQGHRVVLLTGSLEVLVRPLADVLGIETVLSTHLEQQDGVYTGRWTPPHPYAEGKRMLLEQFARENGVDLARSYAYGDSLADRPMLSAVGHPRVVNAGWGMRRLAGRLGWPVLHW